MQFFWTSWLIKLVTNFNTRDKISPEWTCINRSFVILGTDTYQHILSPMLFFSPTTPAPEGSQTEAILCEFDKTVITLTDSHWSVTSFHMSLNSPPILSSLLPHTPNGES